MSDGGSYTGSLPLRFMMKDYYYYYYFNNSPSQAVDDGSMATRIVRRLAPDSVSIRRLSRGLTTGSQLAECKIFRMKEKSAKAGLNAGESLSDLEWHGGIASDRRAGGSRRKEVSQCWRGKENRERSERQ